MEGSIATIPPSWPPSAVTAALLHGGGDRACAPARRRARGGVGEQRAARRAARRRGVPRRRSSSASSRPLRPDDRVARARPALRGALARAAGTGPTVPSTAPASFPERRAARRFAERGDAVGFPRARCRRARAASRGGAASGAAAERLAGAQPGKASERDHCTRRPLFARVPTILSVKSSESVPNRRVATRTGTRRHRRSPSACRRAGDRAAALPSPCAAPARSTLAKPLAEIVRWEAGVDVGVHARVFARASRRDEAIGRASRRGARRGVRPRWLPARRPPPRARGPGARGAAALVAVLSHGTCRTWQVTQLDWIIVAFAAILALFGFRQGFIVGVLSFGGFALGAFLGTRLGPLLLPQGSSSPYAPAFGLVGALLGGAILASGLEGVGFRLRRTLSSPGMGLLDGRSGPARARRWGSGSCGSWPPSPRQTPGQATAACRHPALGDPAQAQRGAAALGRDPQRARAARPAAVDHGPSPTSPRPSRAIAHRRACGRLAQRRARRRHRLRSGDRGLGLGGCAGHRRDQRARGRRRAGHDRRGRRAGAGPAKRSRSRSIRPTTSLCCASPGSTCRRWLAASTASGTPGAILGYPENGPFDVQPGRIGQTQTVSPRTPTARALCRGC